LDFLYLQILVNTNSHFTTICR